MSYSITEAVPTEFYTFKRGQEGWHVIVCQIALNSHFPTPPLTTDGVFGPATEKAAKEVQTALGITADGVVGPETQEHFVKAKCKHAEKGTTPPGLLAGINNIESTYQWSSVSPTNSDGSHDYGTTQENLSHPTASQLTAAFNPDAANHVLAGEVSGFYKAVSGKVTGRRAWELAALNHNWPAAAWAIADGQDEWLSQPEEWLTKKGYANGWGYVNHYIAVSVEQVTSWTV